jgi:hypothetical protein
MTQGRGTALVRSVVESGYPCLVLDRLARQRREVVDAEGSSIRLRDPALPRTQAVAELHAHAGSQFDPAVVEAFVALVNEAPNAAAGAD